MHNHKIRKIVCAVAFAIMSVATMHGHDAVDAEKAEALKHVMEHIHEDKNENLVRWAS